MAFRKVVGAADASGTNWGADYITYTPFVAEYTRTITDFAVLANGNGQAKIGIYSDNAGTPGARLSYNNTPQNVVAGLNHLSIPALALTAGTTYWLAVIGSLAPADVYAAGGSLKYKAMTFGTYSFPDPADAGLLNQAGFHMVVACYAYDPVPTLTGMKHPLMCGTIGATFTANLIFGPLGLWNVTSETRTRSHISADGAVFNLRVRLTVAPGVGKSWTFIVYIQGVPQALTCTISDNNTSGSDLVNSLPVLAGDRITIIGFASGTPAATEIFSSMAFQGTSPNQAIIPVAPYTNAPTSGTVYGNFQGEDLQATEPIRYSIVPCLGKFKNLYVSVETAPTAGKSLQVILRVNASDTALTATITGTNYTASDLVHEVTVNPGDTVDFSITASGNPPSTPIGLGFMFQPSVNGEYPVFGGMGETLNNGAARYNQIQGGHNGFIANEPDTQEVAPIDFTLSCWYGLLDGTPGVGKSYIFTMRPRTSNGNLTMTFADATVSNNDVIHSDVMIGGDLLAFICTPSGGPTGRKFSWGVKSYVSSGAPPASLSSLTKLVNAGII